jgi:hypothetical protein
MARIGAAGGRHVGKVRRLLGADGKSKAVSQVHGWTKLFVPPLCGAWLGIDGQPRAALGTSLPWAGLSWAFGPSTQRQSSGQALAAGSDAVIGEGALPIIGRCQRYRMHPGRIACFGRWCHGE